MTAPTVPAPAPPTLRIWRAGLLIVSLWALAIAAAAVLHEPWAVRRAALFLHLASLVAGFGAVLVADFQGVLWLRGRRRLADMLLVTEALHPVIWGGLVGLVVSGVLLRPNLTLPRTLIKLALVLVVALNGLWATRLSDRLRRQQAQVPDDVDQRLLAQVMVSGAISQAGWWIATLIGFLATTS